MFSYLDTIAGMALGSLTRGPSAPRGFRFVRKIGQGGMGAVYEAVDESLRRKVAIKVLRDDAAADPDDRGRLLQEASTVASLRHPNIVEIYSLIEHRGSLYLVFEYVDGVTLDKAMDPRRGLAPEDALSLLRQIAVALDYAHERGVVHQDIKPANIMVQDGVVKIMDFGLARSERVSASAAAAVRGTAA